MSALALVHASLREFLEVGGFVVVVMALITGFRVLNEWSSKRKTKNWPRATATITDVTMEEQSGLHGNDSLRSWRLHVTYTYMATTEHPGQYTVDYGSRVQAEARMESLPGTEFEVRYDPKAEAASFLPILERPD